MDARIINKYKVKNIQKINAPETENPSAENNKPKGFPKRYTGDINALFADKKAYIINNKEIQEENEENIFIASLTDMTPSDITLNEAAKDVKPPSVDWVRYFAILLSLGLFVFAGFNLVKHLYSYVKESRNYDELRDFFNDEEDLQNAQLLKKTKANSPIPDILALQKQTGERIVKAEVGEGIRDVDTKRHKFPTLSETNSDFLCWIKVEFTTIDYPVVHTTNNDFYLKHDFNKQYSNSGAIFADCKNSRDIAENRNLILYGHNMLNNSIFQPLITAYERREDNFRNGIIELITEEAVYYYEIFSVSEEDPWSGYIQTSFSSDEEYVEFLQTIKDRSIFQKDIVLDEESKIITLSTCVNDVRRNMRFAVRGVLIDVQ